MNGKVDVMELELALELRGFKDPQLPNISTFMNQPYPLRALRTRKWGV
jgi:hypothetical protein